MGLFRDYDIMLFLLLEITLTLCVAWLRTNTSQLWQSAKNQYAISQLQSANRYVDVFVCFMFM